MELNHYLISLLDKKRKDYLTLRSIRDSLPKNLLKKMGLTKGKSSLLSIRKAIQPYLSEKLACFEGSRTLYLGLNIALEEIILNKIKQNPNLSSKQLQQRLPFKNLDFISGLNKLLATQKVQCELHPKTHLPKSFSLLQTQKDNLHDILEDDKTLFRAAFDTVGQGRQFVRIHEIRDFLNWTKQRFDTTLEKLKSDLTIQLQGGDPSLLTAEELKQSYTDAKGRVRITLNWIRNG